MSTRHSSIEGKQPFNDPNRFIAASGADLLARFAMAAGDVSLVLDDAGRIVDATADPEEFPGFAGWVGRDWLDTVTVESKPKVMEMLAAARRGATQRWRQINQTVEDGEVPLRFIVIGMGRGAGSIALGRDMREAAALQQRLLQAQQSLEREYLRLRHMQARYRMLFEESSEAVMIVDAASYRIREANAAAHRLFRAQAGALNGGKLAALFAKADREPMIAFLGSAMVSNAVPPIEVALGESTTRIRLAASGFRQRGAQFLLLRLAAGGSADPGLAAAMRDVVEVMPDAFVLTNAAMVIETANAAFVELVGAASAAQLRGRALGDFVGRPGIDLDLIEGQLAKHDVARNVATVVGQRDGVEGEPVELSAVRVNGDQPCFGFVIRPTGRRLRDLPSPDAGLRSVEQLTELVGRMALRDIVRESTDLIERLCIEAALDYTSNNRASAAEILGLSRQSLYSKLHRYGLGNMADAVD